jgi:hypothetical protein
MIVILKTPRVGWYCCCLGASRVVREEERVLLEEKREEMEGAGRMRLEEVNLGVPMISWTVVE